MILYGASGHCKVIIDILEANGIIIDYIVDDNPELDYLMNYPVKRNTGLYDEAIVSIGANELRKRVVSGIEVGKYLTVRHPSSVVSPRARIGAGSVVMQGAIIQSCAYIGNHCIVNTGASVDHDVKLGDFVHVAPHATVTGGVTVGEGTWIGAGAVVKQGIKIGCWSVIGAGAVVVDDIPDGVVAYGNKCMIARKVNMEKNYNMGGGKSPL